MFFSYVLLQCSSVFFSCVLLLCYSPEFLLQCGGFLRWTRALGQRNRASQIEWSRSVKPRCLSSNCGLEAPRTRSIFAALLFTPSTYMCVDKQSGDIVDIAVLDACPQSTCSCAAEVQIKMNAPHPTLGPTPNHPARHTTPKHIRTRPPRPTRQPTKNSKTKNDNHM